MRHTSYTLFTKEEELADAFVQEIINAWQQFRMEECLTEEAGARALWLIV